MQQATDSAGYFVDADHFRLTLGSECVNAFLKCEFDFLLRFANTGENAFRRVSTGGDDPLELAAADNVKPAPGIGQCSQHAKVGVGFYRKMNRVIQR